VTTRVQLLPFEAISWENFERLCHRLTALDGDVEHCARYGRQGDAQEGIDIYARQTNGRYHCLQAKRHRHFGPNKLREAVDVFLSGSWAARSDRFTLAVQASLRSTKDQDETERQAARLNARGIIFTVLDGDKLTDVLREYPVLVDDFFGRSWVTSLLGQDIADKLGARLDGADFLRIRSQLSNVYRAQFHSVDPGSFGSVTDEESRPELSLLERFQKPDMLVREAVQSVESAVTVQSDSEGASMGLSAAIYSPRSNSKRKTRSSDTSAIARMRRLPLVEWLGESLRLVVLGDAGYGKSTLLRVIALDLLHSQEHFPELAARWGQHIPIYIPFARWSSQVVRDGNAIGIKEIVRRSLEQLLTKSIVDLLDRAMDDQRILVLIDGLDEWGNEQAARATLSTLITTVEAHGIPVIVSSRPQGLSRIGTLPASWKRGTIAPLSASQQEAIASRWFERYSSAPPNSALVSEVSLRTNRFMADLARDSNLGALAAVPLLLIGLITLALRGQILPRTRNDIYDQLVRVLLEVHPNNRATASGDTESRFRYASDPAQRRAAIAQLAFAVRAQTGGAGMPVATARNTLRDYLASPHGFDLAESEAAAAANEILSVNAETQGLIVEKAPGEVGFVHASFEEFLGAEHIGSWPFKDIEMFVNAHAAEGRWRNVITNLLSRIQRRDEFDRLVAVIEMPDFDEVTRYHRQFLLGDIAFGAAMRSTTVAKRLALAAMSRVETEDWLPARREALTSVLKGLADPMLKVEVEQRLIRWLPARLSSYSRAALIEAFKLWKPTKQLQDLLLQAMSDEEREVQRAAAAAYANIFSSSNEACERLLDGLARSRDLASATALLESLAQGWSDLPKVKALFSEAWQSNGAELRLVGVLGLATTGILSDEARDFVLQSQSFWSGLSYQHRDLAAEMLRKYWHGNDVLIKSAVKRTSRASSSSWPYEEAIIYLLDSPVDHPDVRAWVSEELKRKYPFSIVDGRQAWSKVGRIAVTDSEIRIAANAYWCDPSKRLINMSSLPSYVASVNDPILIPILIEVLGQKKQNFEKYWALNALLTGWGRDHPDVENAIDTLAERPDEELDDLVPFMAQIMRNKTAARERLIRMSSRPQLRRDLLAAGLAACGCDSSDNDAVAAILAFPERLKGIFDPSYQLLENFAAHPTVRALAIARIREANGPLSAIASAYKDDPEIADALFDAAVPLPVELRTQVVEVAAIGATGTVLEAVLTKAMLETDPELRVRMVIAQYRTLPQEARDTARQELLTHAVAVGPGHESVRAAALAGLVMIGELSSLAALEVQGKPVPLAIGSIGESIASVERLVCERFAEFRHVFGDSLKERIKSLGDSNTLSRILSAAPSASPAARSAFLELAELGDTPQTPNALRALAIERPASELLLARCWDVLDRDNQTNDQASINGDVALILRDHFPNNLTVRERLADRFKKNPTIANALPLAIFSPGAEELAFPTNPETHSANFSYWAVAMHVAAHRADSETFCILLESMVCRQRRSQFDGQHITNLAVEERLLRDKNLEQLLRARITRQVDPNISGSFARYLAAAGRLDLETRSQILDLLEFFGSTQRMPVVAYDAIADKLRAVRTTLLDAVSAELG
jgi:hypothetical protein